VLVLQQSMSIDARASYSDWVAVSDHSFLMVAQSVA
jgi:hypothetical protein